MTPQPGYLTLAKTAQLLRTTPINVLMHVRKGLLEQVERNGEWFITIGSFESFVSENGIKKSSEVCRSSCSHSASCSSSCG